MKKFLLIASLACSMAAIAQSPTSKIQFKKGQKLEIVTETKKTTTMDFMGQSMENTANSTITEIFDIEDVDPAGATIEYKVKRVLLTASGMGRTESFDSEKEGDRKGELGKILEKSLKNKFTMKVDAAGKVISVKADDDNPNTKNKNAEEEAMTAMIASQLGIQMSVPKQGDPTIFKILPEKAIGVGDTWDTESNVDGFNKKITYKVASLNDDEIVLDYTEDMKINSKQQMMGTEASITGNGKSTGKITIDRATGLLKSKTVTSNASTNLEAQGMSIPSTEKSTVTVTVKSS